MSPSSPNSTTPKLGSPFPNQPSTFPSLPPSPTSSSSIHSRARTPTTPTFPTSPFQSPSNTTTTTTPNTHRLSRTSSNISYRSTLTPTDPKAADEWEARLTKREGEIRKRMENRARAASGGNGNDHESNGGLASPLMVGSRSIARGKSEEEDKRSYHYRRKMRYSTMGFGPPPENPTFIHHQSSTTTSFQPNSPISPTSSSITSLTPISTPIIPAHSQSPSHSGPGSRPRPRHATHDGSSFLSPLSASAVVAGMNDRQGRSGKEGGGGGSSREMDDSPVISDAASAKSISSLTCSVHSASTSTSTSASASASASALIQRYRSFGNIRTRQIDLTGNGSGSNNARNPIGKRRSTQRLSIIGLTSPGYEPLSNGVINLDELDAGLMEGCDVQSISGSGSGSSSLLSPYSAPSSSSRTRSLGGNTAKTDTDQEVLLDNSRPASTRSSSFTSTSASPSGSRSCSGSGSVAFMEGDRENYDYEYDDGEETDEQTSSLKRLSAYFADPYCPSSPRVVSPESSSRERRRVKAASSSGMDPGAGLGESSLAGKKDSASHNLLSASGSPANIPSITASDASPSSTHGEESPFFKNLSRPQSTRTSPSRSPRPISIIAAPPTPPPAMKLPARPTMVISPPPGSTIATRRMATWNGTDIKTSPPKQVDVSHEDVTETASQFGNGNGNGNRSPKKAQRESVVQEFPTGGWGLGMGSTPSTSGGIYKATREIPSTPDFQRGHAHTDSDTLNEIKICVSPSAPSPTPGFGSVSGNHQQSKPSLAPSPRISMSHASGKMQLDFPLPPVRSSSLGSPSSVGMGRCPTVEEEEVALVTQSRKASVEEEVPREVIQRPVSPTVADLVKSTEGAIGEQLLADFGGAIALSGSPEKLLGTRSSMDSVMSDSIMSVGFSDGSRRMSSTSTVSTAPSSVIHLTPTSSKRDSYEPSPSSPVKVCGGKMLRMETLEELMEGLHNAEVTARRSGTPRISAFSPSITSTPRLRVPTNNDAGDWGEPEIPRFQAKSILNSPALGVNLHNSNKGLTKSPSLDFKFGGAAGKKNLSGVIGLGLRKSALPLPVNRRQVPSPTLGRSMSVRQ